MDLGKTRQYLVPVSWHYALIETSENISIEASSNSSLVYRYDQNASALLSLTQSHVYQL
jgi:hypothetical protein